MGVEFLGKELNRKIIDDIKSTGADACGENGEYQTFVVDVLYLKIELILKMKA